MRSSLKRKELRTRVREKVTAELTATGEVVVGVLTQTICVEQKTLIAEIGEELARASVARMVRGQLNSWATIALVGSGQMTLFGVPDDILAELPPTITVPVENDEPKHVALPCASVGELRAYECLLAEQIIADQRKHRAVRYVVTKCKGAPDDLKLTAAFAPQAAE